MKLTQMDTGQIVRSQHDENQSAQRVTIVGGDFNLGPAIQEGLKNLKLELPERPTFEYKQPMIIEKEVIVKQVQTVNIPTIIKEYEKIEVPVVVYETKIVEIEKPIITTRVEMVEKQIIVKEVQNLDIVLKKMMIIQAITLGLILLKLFL